MLFKRRTPVSWRSKALNTVWPRMGWKRTLHYFKHRVIRIQDSAYAVAAGLAVGCAVSWSPAFGFHLIMTFLFCWLIRANWLAGFLGTAFGNPWTFPLLWWVSYQVGHFLFDAMGWGMMFQTLDDPIPLEDMPERPVKMLLPMLFGGFVMGIVTFPLFYYPFFYFIKGAKAARKARITRKVHKAAQQLTGQEK